MLAGEPTGERWRLRDPTQGKDPRIKKFHGRNPDEYEKREKCGARTIVPGIAEHDVHHNSNKGKSGNRSEIEHVIKHEQPNGDDE